MIHPLIVWIKAEYVMKMFDQFSSVLLVICLLVTIVTCQEVQTIQQCLKCKHWEPRLDAKFCSQCGQPLVTKQVIAIVQCPVEKKVLEPTARFCPFCGNPVKITYQEVPALEPQLGNKPTPGHSPSLNPEDSHLESSPPSISPNNAQIPTSQNQNSQQPTLWNTPPTGLQEIASQIIDEGLRKTSEQRQVTRILYTGDTASHDVEIFYKNLIGTYGAQARLSIIRSDDPICKAPHLLLKFTSPDQAIKLEVDYYSYNIMTPQQDQKRIQTLQQQLKEEIKPLQTIEKEMQSLRAIQQKQPSPEIASRLLELQQRYQISANSTTYWQLKAAQEMLTRKSNILLLTIIEKR